jgi:predicted NACHT family NTPase
LSSIYSIEYLNADTIASGGFTLLIWSISTGQTLRKISTGSAILSLKILSNGIHLAAGLGYNSANINIYNINTGNLATTLKGHASDVLDLALINNDDLLASSSADRTIRLWNLTTNTFKYILEGHTSKVNCLKQISPDVLASSSDDMTIKLWNIRNGQLVRTLEGHLNLILMSMDLLSVGSQILVSGSLDQTIMLWDWNTGECLNTIETDSYVYSLAVIDQLKGKKKPLITVRKKCKLGLLD